MAGIPNASSIRSLVQHVRSGQPAQQMQAADQLGRLAEASPSAQRAIGAAGAVPALAWLLSSSSMQLRRSGAHSLSWVIFDEPDLVEAFIAAGGLPPLLGRLASTAGNAIELHSAVCLASSAMRGERGGPADTVRRALVARGCLPILVDLLVAAEMQRVAATALVELCGASASTEFADAAAAAGAVPALAALLGSSDARLQLTAAMALSNIACGGRPAIAAMLEGSAISALGQLLSSSGSGGDSPSCGLASSQDLRKTAAKCLANLTDGPVEEELAAIAAAGAISGLVHSLQLSSDDPEPVAVPLVLNALGRLCQHSPDRTRAAVAAGGVQAAERLLRRPDLRPEVRSQVSAALRELSDACEAQPSTSRPAQTPAAQPAVATATAAASTSPQPSPPAPRVCAAPGCGATRSLRRCAGCGIVRYCSEACGRAHWREHKTECRRLQAAQAAATAHGEGPAAKRP